MRHLSNQTGNQITPVGDRTPVYRPIQPPDRRNSNANFTPAARAFATPMLRYTDQERVHYVDARYIGPRIETVVKKVMRSEFASLVIVLLVMAAVFSTLFVVALVMGWL